MNTRILLLILLYMAGLTGFPQSLSLSNANGPVAPNSTIFQAGTPDSNTLLTFLNVTNTGSAAINVVCKKIQMTMLDSTHIYLCWANHCYAPSILVSPYSVPVAPGETYTGFKAIYAQMAYNNFFIGESVVRYVFFDQDNVSDSVSVTVRYQTFPVGLGETAPGAGSDLHIFPNPASAMVRFDYSIPAGSGGELEIRDVSGACVQTHAIAGETGHIHADVTPLSKGIWFCSLRVDGKTTLTKILVVR